KCWHASAPRGGTRGQDDELQLSTADAQPLDQLICANDVVGPVTVLEFEKAWETMTRKVHDIPALALIECAAQPPERVSVLEHAELDVQLRTLGYQSDLASERVALVAHRQPATACWKTEHCKNAQPLTDLLLTYGLRVQQVIDEGDLIQCKR